MKYTKPTGKEKPGQYGYYPTPSAAGTQVNKWQAIDLKTPDVADARGKAGNAALAKINKAGGQVFPKGTKVPGQQYYKGKANATIQSFKKGGTVPKTGIYKLHKGEKVITKQMVDKYHKLKGKI